MDNFSRLMHTVGILIKNCEDLRARDLFNTEVIKSFDPEMVNEEDQIFYFELDAYFNDVNMRRYNIPGSTRDFILDSFDDFVKRQD